MIFADLITEQKIVAAGADYTCDDGRQIKRYQGTGKRRGSYVEKWELGGKLYNTVVGAYLEAEYDVYAIIR